MCGIFGYVGPNAGAEILMDSLKRLEYRGYDSWGIALAYADKLRLHREAGRITNAALPGEETQAPGCLAGIAHTRWATHGPPTVENAHPHTACNGRLAIVHNGIIENHNTLREKLQAQGAVFSSETDTEVIAHLIDRFMQDGVSFREAFLDAMKLIEGTYGVAAPW